MSKPVYLDAAELVATIKSVLITLEVPIMVDTKSPLLEHYDLRARGDKETGVWVFYITAKEEADEEGPVGHA